MENGCDRKDELYEEEHVHKVYQEIAPHFSSTRYKPWPIVERFLNERSPGAVGIDVGCGNGKYLNVNQNIFIIASDRSEALTTIASQHHPHSAIVADTLNLPHRNGGFDFAISIAMVHHLSLPERRVKAIASILEALKQPCDTDPAGGKALIYVWALEQKNSRRGWDAGDDQDVMVPWVMKGKGTDKKQKNKKSDKSSNDLQNLSANEADGQITAKSEGTPTTYLRYYHLYRENELEENVVAAHGRILDHGYEKDNWWVVASPFPRP